MRPRVLAADEAQGFLLLSDLGSTLYLKALRRRRRRRLADRADARRDRAPWCNGSRSVDASGLPPYDDALLRRELQLFPDWCVQREFSVTWTDEQQAHVADARATCWWRARWRSRRSPCTATGCRAT